MISCSVSQALHFRKPSVGGCEVRWKVCLLLFAKGHDKFRKSAFIKCLLCVYIVKLQVYQKVQGLPTLQINFLFCFLSFNLMAEEPRGGPSFALGCHIALEVLRGFRVRLVGARAQAGPQRRLGETGVPVSRPETCKLRV